MTAICLITTAATVKRHPDLPDLQEDPSLHPTAAGENHPVQEMPLPAASSLLRSVYQEQYQREVRASRRVVMWATILSIGLAISLALLLYRLLIIGTIL
ncbi:hypothetical protein CLV84_2041 [Neolewinella xylanilytica]|uniref:Uncharacterized protein n=1 Tax=Neolewinella xylanilytica TaxID=1514080 RepID=A0A2S6I238_9BACT|nr:hypothetical protein CLV84_2041 [Neolewinella xylanilytica]